MEPLHKRLRLYSPVESGNSIADDSDNFADLYADKYSGLEDGGDMQEEEEEEDAEPVDPDEQLEQTRAQLDLKLKSKFEAIFEKYGRDFTGIGDEIDLRTGEIVVDNGHLFQMQDERDDGTTRPSLLEAFTQAPDERFGSIELDDDVVDEVHDSHVKLDDMEEDDMILFQNSGLPSGRPKTPSPRRGMPQDSRLLEEENMTTTNVLTTSFPSENEILAQFGQDLGPKIAKYVAQQRVQDDSTIEPAWRTPGLPLATPGKRPILKSILLQPDSDRSPSPKGATSVWAPKMPPGRPRRDGADAAAVFRGETIIHDRTWFSSGYISTTVTKKRTERVSQSRSKRTISVPLNETLATEESELQLSAWADLEGGDSSHVFELGEASDEEPESSGEKLAKSYKPRRSWSDPSFHLEQRTSRNPGQQSSRHIDEEKLSSKRKRKRGPFIHYTKADDDVLLEWVDDILKQGILLWSRTHWHLLAEKYPRHSYLGWKDRYRRQFYNKDANPSIKDDGSKGSLENEEDVSQSARKSVIDSQSEHDDCLLSNKSTHEVSNDVTVDSTISPMNIKSQINTINNCRASPIDLETLDPALHPPLVIEDTKIKEDCKCLQQWLTPSNSFSGDLHRESCMNHIVRSNTTTLRDCRSSSLQPQMGLNEDGPLTLRQEENLVATVVRKDDHEFTAQGSNNATGTAKQDIIFSTDTSIPITEAITSKEDYPPQHIKQNIFDTTYDFSDEEDEMDSMGTRHLNHLQSIDALTPKHSVKRQIIDLTGEDSIPVKKGLLNPRLSNSSFLKNNQSPISVSSSSSSSDLDESEEINFFLERTPPTGESHMTLSSILGPDSFYNLRKNSSPAKQSSQEKGSAGIGADGRVLSDNVMPALNGNPVMKRTTLSSMKLVKSFRKSAEDSPGGSIIETPGGTKKRCGENGFRCGKGFCFKCLEG